MSSHLGLNKVYNNEAVEHNKHGQVRGFLKAFQKEELYIIPFQNGSKNAWKVT